MVLNLVFIFSLFLSSVHAEDREINIPANQEELAVRCKADMEARVPTSIQKSFSLRHRAYEVSYNFEHRVPNWVFYQLSSENLKLSCAKRKDDFKPDPLLVNAVLPAVNGSDYKRTGFDRGHMAPSGDFRWDPQLDNETFFMSNMCPQTANLNQKAWNSLEDRIRKWACAFGELKIYTGPLLKEGLPRLNSCVSIPEEFFKVIVYFKDGKYRGIGFIYNQKDSGDPYREKAVSIRTIEERTGINFFKDQLASKVQDNFETAFTWSDWEAQENCVACPDRPRNKEQP